MSFSWLRIEILKNKHYNVKQRRTKMAILQKSSKGEYYVAKMTSGGGGGNRTRTIYRNWWLVKQNSSTSCGITIRTISFPKEFVGKKVRLRLEVIDDIDTE